MKYKLINKTTKEEYICEKVVIDGWDYYVSNAYGNPAIATNYPYHDILNIPKVVEEVDIIEETACKIANVSLNWYKDKNNKDRDESIIFHVDGIILGYNKSQETHPFSEEDMIEFAEWKNEKYKLLHGEYVDANDYYSIPDLKSVKKYTTKELLQLWKEQRPKTLYYV